MGPPAARRDRVVGNRGRTRAVAVGFAAIQLCAIAALVACGSDPGPDQAGSSTGSGAAGGSSGSGGGGPLLAIPLTGCPLDSYFAPVSIGGQAFTLLVDTGSTDTAVALSSCATCDVSPKFSAPSGSCSAQLDSQTSLGFVGGVCAETISVGGELPVVTMNLVGIDKNVEFFTNMDCTGVALSSGQPRYQGILGLGTPAFDTIGRASQDAYVSELTTHGVADEFALLLCSVGGQMWFGGYDPAFAKGPAQYTPLGMPLGWTISVSSVGLGSTNLGPGDPRTIIDTGTQFSSIPTAAYTAFMAEVDPGFATVFGASHLGAAFAGSSCVAPAGAPTQAAVDAALPPMTMTLPSVDGGSFTLTLPATRSYLVPATPAGGGAVEYCLAIRDSAETGGLAFVGGPLMRANITLFDLAHARLGFVPQAFCD